MIKHKCQIKILYSVFGICHFDFGFDLTFGFWHFDF